ncbi:ejaculatory bulb-specific protein 3 [Halyomorpha halys]|uniref:ejaculatory bulb-specific protein 3 n=1 Tax=Halyomorpha halys TaxID=286706 RepID=UPI0006D4F92C|nr:ejaculatory bulb-specific protein 3-like [Halyomorpha halys]
MLRTLLLLAPLALACFCQAAATQQSYTDKWDRIDVDQILKNDRILKKYVDCLMDRGKCSPDAQELRKVLPEAIQTECAKCTDSQKRMAGKALSYILQNKRNYWNELIGKYDPKGEFRKKYEYEEDK